MAAAVGAGGGAVGPGVMSESDAIDYSVHEAWNEATNVYLLVVLASLALLVYARRNKRKIMRIFTVPPTAEAPSEPNFYDSMKKIRLRQQLEMYSLDGTRGVGSGRKWSSGNFPGVGQLFIARKYDQQPPQKQTDSVQLLME